MNTNTQPRSRFHNQLPTEQTGYDTMARSLLNPLEASDPLKQDQVLRSYNTEQSPNKLPRPLQKESDIVALMRGIAKACQTLVRMSDYLLNLFRQGNDIRFDES